MPKINRKGYAVLTAGAKLEPFEYTVGELGPLEVDIEVTHNGVCHSDIAMRDNDWGISAFPFIPGHEVVGNVVAKGEQVTNFSVGDRVGYGWYKDSCGGCAKCMKGNENVCFNGPVGLITAGSYGGFQKIMRAPAKHAFKIPEGLESSSAAPLLCAGITVYSPLRKYITFPGARVAVMGIGGLGHLAMQFAAAMGAEVTAISTSADKEAEAKSFGAHRFVLSSAATTELANSQDLIIHTISSATNYGDQMKILRKDGVLCIVGLPISEIKVGVADVVLDQKSVVGSVGGGRGTIQEMLDFAALKGIKAKVEEMPLSKVNEAMERADSNKARYRIVLTTDM